MSDSKRILICDDESRLATLTAGLLEEYGFDPITVEQGCEAMRELTRAETPIGVLLLDVNLSSGQSASDVLSEMVQQGVGASVILTSGLAEEDVPRQMIQHPRVMAYLPKPYSVEQLVETIQRVSCPA